MCVCVYVWLCARVPDVSNDLSLKIIKEDENIKREHDKHSDER